MLTNIALVLAPVLGPVIFVLFALYFIQKGAMKAVDADIAAGDQDPEYKDEAIKMFKGIRYVILVSALLLSVFQVMNSPMIRPVTDVHNKAAEVTKYRALSEAVPMPVLKDNTRRSAREELPEMDTSTPLFDKAMGRAAE